MATPAKRRFSLAEQLREELKVERKPSQDIFSEEPVPLDVFIRDRKYLGNPPLSELQYRPVRHLEQIYTREVYPLMVENFGEYWTPVRFVNFVYLQFGKGSGKDHLCRIAAARVAYLLLCLKSPQEFYGFAPQDEIHTINVAMNAHQARRAFFKPLGTLLNNSPWFKDKLKSEPTDMSTSIRLDKQIELISGHSDVENFEGLNPILAVADEISGFESAESMGMRGLKESTRSAEGVMSILRTSCATRFPESYKVAAISYPRYIHDPIQNLTDEAREDYKEVGEENSRYYVDGPRATWEVNPRIKGKEAFAEDYKKDPVMARAKYECLPERSSNAYFRNSSAINQALPDKTKEEDWVEPLTVEYYWGVDEEGAKAEGSYELATVPGWQAKHILSPFLQPYEGAVYALHADLALKADCAGISMCHIKNWERREHQMGDQSQPKEGANMQVDDRPVLKVDFVASYEADLTAETPDGEAKAREIQIRWFRNLIRELKRRGFVIGLVTFDNFQSADSIQILESWGIPSAVQSVDRKTEPYSTLREVMYDGRLEGYYRKRLKDEIEGLTLFPNGKLDHPAGASKDEADALCGAVYGALQMGGDEGEEPEVVDTTVGQGMDVYTRLGGGDDIWGVSQHNTFEDHQKYFENSWA